MPVVRVLGQHPRSATLEQVLDEPCHSLGAPDSSATAKCLGGDVDFCHLSACGAEPAELQDLYIADTGPHLCRNLFQGIAAEEAQLQYLRIPGRQVAHDPVQSLAGRLIANLCIARVEGCEAVVNAGAAWGRAKRRVQNSPRAERAVAKR